MEYHFVNVLILLFLITYTHRANCSTKITDDEKASIENGLTVGSALFLGARTTSHPRHQGQSLILRFERVDHRSLGNTMGDQNDQIEGHAPNRERRCEKSLCIANEA